jgi:hypothetical protein
MIKYNVRSRQLVDLVSEMKRGKLIISPHFQRNLVWRTIHKVDFIKTILLGYPFPQIFLAKGELNAEELTTTSVVVDGQQRMNAILEFIDNEYPVDNKLYKGLAKEDRDEFLKYEIALIELEMESDDPEIIEIFHRLNRTFYSLTKIEKLATEYAASEFMLVAKLLSKEINFEDAKPKHLDPNIPEEFKSWGRKMELFDFQRLIVDSPIFTNYEVSRKVHLMFVLNVLGTIERGIFNRNISESILEDYKDEFSGKEQIVKNLNIVAKFYNGLRLARNSYWYNKANSFTLIHLFYDQIDKLATMDKQSTKEKLNTFESNLPEAFQLAAKEGVNNRKERSLRYNAMKELLF